MKLTFLYYASDSFASRAKVLHESIQKFYPESTIVHVNPESTKLIGSYIDGMAKNRLKSTLRLLEANACDAVLVLGADCELFSRLPELEEKIETNDVILVPHVFDPHPWRHLMAEIYKSGHANADVMCFKNSEQSKKILNWMISVTEGNDINNGSFYEQTWLSSLPFIFDGVHIMRHPGYNVGYWDANHREIRKMPDGWETHGAPFRLVQYSGYMKGNPHRMSRYSREIAKGDVVELFEAYDRRIDQ